MDNSIHDWKRKYDELHDRIHGRSAEQSDWMLAEQVRVADAEERLALLRAPARSAQEEQQLHAAAQRDAAIIAAAREAGGHLPAVYSVPWADLCATMLRIDANSRDVTSGEGANPCRVSSYKSGNPEKDSPCVRCGPTVRPPVTHVALRFMLEPFPVSSTAHSHDADHLCHNCLCHRFGHVAIGPRLTNLDRQRCRGSTRGCGYVDGCEQPVYCRHVPACLHATSVGHKRRRLSLPSSNV
ncbi:MAG: hypothetical protein JSR57_08555 [Verrucomicrobia bacterium]|nr:hypothetical protein [Verrucomicrobiota bacterium]